MDPWGICPLIVELLLGGGRPEFWACDRSPEDLIPLGSCEYEVLGRKPEQQIILCVLFFFFFCVCVLM